MEEREKATIEQLYEQLGNNFDITICSDIVNGLYFEYKQLYYENEQLKEQLQQENQELKIQLSAREEVANKYKEAIDKAIEYINSYDDGCYTDSTCKYKVAELNITKLLDILKESD